MIGTCNDLLCVQRGSGSIAVLNVVARAMQDSDPPPTGLSSLHESTYSFGSHPATGVYKTVHVPCRQSAELDAVHVLTVEDGSEWREVPAPAGSGCRLRFGLVSILVVTYWVTKDAGRIMSFDLKDESFALLEWQPMPVLLWMDDDHTCRLTDVPGRLGLVVWRPRHEHMRAETEVWVLEGEREEERAWVRSFTVLAQGEKKCQEIALPHVVHGKHVLITCREPRDGRLWLTYDSLGPPDVRLRRDQRASSRVDARRAPRLT
ncbi:hypothetical protein BAE44_0008830 [Dichanthelium oligosanthes]|uniref:F-box associated beta-propeller type 3 domain-containing protein n=1 Tax=Dichanthelium oligosanthes TaxID=888268 RepID=A0A1E5VYG3_9POAL|nr:hypothetical protein BAE44_0008830 [Dichanthelium oligosanthes]